MGFPHLLFPCHFLRVAALPAGPSTQKSPIARKSRELSRKARIASSGVRTIGSSWILNDVLMMTGIPVRLRYSSMMR